MASPLERLGELADRYRGVTWLVGGLAMMLPGAIAVLFWC